MVLALPGNMEDHAQPLRETEAHRRLFLGHSFVLQIPRERVDPTQPGQGGTDLKTHISGVPALSQEEE